LAVKKYSLKNYLPHRKKQVITFPFFLKRVTDVLVSSTGLLILSPVFAVIATLIKLESRGPIFYTALRAGKGFKVFKFYKFRSMVANADKEVDNLSHKNQYTNIDGPKFFKISNDPRVTRLGKFLRNTSMDEIPQLLNVLKGDMSLVGNRPLPIYEAVTLTTDEFVERFSAPAGITGLWQVKKRGKANMSTEERIYLDICYSRSYNFVADLKIMVKTPLALFQKSDV
ncbi:MAG: sugar transferase, partial [Ferruginibacter sp.]